ncbi:MAG: ribonuclease J [Bifidobacteriaceae bacterium]|jgi:ribonuclease J|nr:ribonuclease J [Bifidobacteriaceae bacterium]
MEVIQPPKLKPDTMRLVPLGGLGEVGRNMMTLEYQGRILILDCGVLFPRDEEPGVDLILPDFSYIIDRLHQVDAIVVSHGHEDHIGGIPYLLQMKEDIPIVASRFSLALIEKKLKRFKIKPKTREVKAYDKLKIGKFDLEFIAANHSIPDALCISVKTSAGSLVFTGDIKLDQTPMDGRITDLNHLAKISEQGIDLFLADSTNAEVKGVIPTESSISPALDFIFHKAQGKIVVASFASHVHRVQQIIDTAAEYGRKVCFVGWSMVNTMNIAQELGYLKVPKGIILELRELEKYPDKKIVLMCTGSQGEPMAALSRIARGDHSKVKVGKGDSIILASSLIPGNEKQVSQVINDLTMLNVEIFHNKNSAVHVSGHAAETDLLYLYNVARPKNALPIHGEPRHLIANARVARKAGVKNAIAALNGSVIDLRDGIAKKVGKFHNDYIYVDGSAVGEIDETDLETRRILASEGFISCFATVDLAEKKVVAGPEFIQKGFAEDISVFNDVKPDVIKKLNSALQDGVTNTHRLAQLMRRVIGPFLGHKLQRSPLILPVVNAVGHE